MENTPMFNGSDRILWVLVDGDIISAIAQSRTAARNLKTQQGLTGSVRKALVTLI